MVNNFIKIVLIVFFFAGNLFCGEEKMQFNLMPRPEHIAMQAGKFRLTDSFQIAITNAKTNRLEKYARRVLYRLAGRTGLFFPNVGMREGCGGHVSPVGKNQPATRGTWPDT